ncbi:hypothetical protein FRB94_001112 [Tulasnella sp. JGI-2019a]|nr:hypothetical protein FRB94_001112 [Tulasnella sp. JGI-2019a]
MRSITLNEVQRAVEEIRQYCRMRLMYGIALVISHHLASHYPLFFALYGPAYAWWLFAFEAYNGDMGNVNTNNHAGGELETTMVRNWVSRQLVLDLLTELPADSSPKEKELVNQLVNQKDRDRGSYLTQNASFASTDGLDDMTVKAHRSVTIELRKLADPGMYDIVFQFARAVWPDLDLVDDLAIEAQGNIFLGGKVARRLEFIVQAGSRYGSQLSNRTKADRYAMITRSGVRVPAEVVLILQLKYGDKPPELCLIVRRFVDDEAIPQMPWSLQAVALGYSTFYLQRFHPLEAVKPADLACPMALVPIQMTTFQEKLGVGISWDRNALDSDELWLEEDEVY